MNLGNNVDGVQRVVRSGVLVVENWLFNAGPHNGEQHTLVLVSTCTNEVFCYAEGQLLASGSSATPLWSINLSVPPLMRTGSNIPPPLGVCGTPIVDIVNRRMFVVAVSDNGSGLGEYTIFNLALDRGAINSSQVLKDTGAPNRVTFDPTVLDQRTSINLADGWLWFGFAAFLAYDEGSYYGWVVAVDPDNLGTQLYQPMISQNSSTNLQIFAGGVWGLGGVAEAGDGSVFALTGNATQSPNANDKLNDPNYWAGAAASNGPGSLGDYFNAIVKLQISGSGNSAQLSVADWFQSSSFTQSENSSDWDFGGSSPVVLPPIDGRQLVVYVPKDGNIFVHDSAHLGQYSSPLTLETFADAFKQGGNDTKVALAYVRTPDGTDRIVVGADTNSFGGGVASYQIDATASPPTLTQTWLSPKSLNDSFGSPTIIANPILDPSSPPNPFALAWVVDGPNDNNGVITHNTMRAYDVETGAIVYDSGSDVSEGLPHFAAITSGGNSIFCPTVTGFIGFTQFAAVTPSLSFIVDKSTFGMGEVMEQNPTPMNPASFSPAYWISVDGVLPSDIGVSPGHLTPSVTPKISSSLVTAVPLNVQTGIQAMLEAGTFSGAVIPQNPALPDEPQGFLFPFSVGFSSAQGFQDMMSAMPTIPYAIVQVSAELPLPSGNLSGSAEVELVTGADPYFVDVDPDHPTLPTWLSYDLRVFTTTQGSLNNDFGLGYTPDTNVDTIGFINDVLAGFKSGSIQEDAFLSLPTDEGTAALEWLPSHDGIHNVFNFALARVEIQGNQAGPTAYPVRVFFRLFQAQNTVSNFDTQTTYRIYPPDPQPPGTPRIPLFGIQKNSSGVYEYVTAPCFATARLADMKMQSDSPNAFPITVVPGETAYGYFGCWIDSNQTTPLMPASPPTNPADWDGPFPTSPPLLSLHDAFSVAPHQCVVAEIRYDEAPVVPNATTATSDKLAQRNVAWIDGPNPGDTKSRRMVHPIQVRPTPYGHIRPDDLMITWGSTPKDSVGELYFPALSADTIIKMANELYPWQLIQETDEHTISVKAEGVTFIPLPTGTAAVAGLMTITLPAGKVHMGDRYDIQVRQVSDAVGKGEDQGSRDSDPPERNARESNVEAGRDLTSAWRVVSGQCQISIVISTKQQILFEEERLLANLRWLELHMPREKRWFPVLQRYIGYVAGRVDGFGGNSSSIAPSQTGWVPGLPKGGSIGEEFFGKVMGLVYDHFGDFEGFILETEAGKRHRFASREHTIFKLAQEALADRTLVLVIAGEPDRLVRTMIVF
jgi:hypothetical protein